MGEAGAQRDVMTFERTLSQEALGILAVDLGLRAGFAFLSVAGEVLWCRSQHFANRSAIGRASWGVLQSCPAAGWVVVEGERALANAWRRAALKRGLGFCRVDAGQWRAERWPQGAQRSGAWAKAQAVQEATALLRRQGRPAVQPLRHDTAEAVLIGLWFAGQLASASG